MTKNKETIVKTIVQKKPASSPSKRKKKSRRNRRANNSSSSGGISPAGLSARYSMESTLGAVDHPRAKELMAALIAPDMMGPIRIPRSGASQRTGLAIDRTRTNLIGAAGQVVGLRVNTNYNTAISGVFQNIASLTTATALAVAAGPLPGEQFPPITSIGDCNIVAISILLSYFGNPLTVAGEMILGTVGAFDLTTSSYNAMSFYPGFIRLPIAEVINTPIRVFGRKVSPSANEFITITSTTEDYELPTVLLTGLPVGEFLSVDIVRTYEYRSTVATASVVPYEKSTESFTKDMNLYNDVEAVISEVYAPVMEAWTPYFENGARALYSNDLVSTVAGSSAGIGGQIPNFIQGASAMLSAYMGRNAARNRVGLY